jgi:hypothetical protein
MKDSKVVICSVRTEDGGLKLTARFHNGRHVELHFNPDQLVLLIADLSHEIKKSYDLVPRNQVPVAALRPARGCGGLS